MTDKPYETISENFRYNLHLLRASEQLSGQELSKQLEMSEKRGNDLEWGKTPPTLQDLVSIIVHFNINFDDLLLDKLTIKIPSTE